LLWSVRLVKFWKSKNSTKKHTHHPNIRRFRISKIEPFWIQNSQGFTLSKMSFLPHHPWIFAIVLGFWGFLGWFGVDFFFGSRGIFFCASQRVFNLRDLGKNTVPTSDPRISMLRYHFFGQGNSVPRRVSDFTNTHI